MQISLNTEFLESSAFQIQILLVRSLRVWSRGACYRKLMLKFRWKSSLPRSRIISLLIQKITRGKVQVFAGHFHSSLKIHANIIFSMVRGAHCAHGGHDPFTLVCRRGWRTKKWGSSANTIHSRVIYTRHYHVVPRISHPPLLFV